MGAPTQPSRRPARGRRYLRLPELGDLLLLAWAGLKVNGRRLSPTGQCWPARSSLGRSHRWRSRCRCEEMARDTVVRELAHEPFG
jgi:hypothetical protein